MGQQHRDDRDGRGTDGGDPQRRLARQHRRQHEADEDRHRRTQADQGRDATPARERDDRGSKDGGEHPQHGVALEVDDHVALVGRGVDVGLEHHVVAHRDLRGTNPHRRSGDERLTGVQAAGDHNLGQGALVGRQVGAGPYGCHGRGDELAGLHLGRALPRLQHEHADDGRHRQGDEDGQHEPADPRPLSHVRVRPSRRRARGR